MKKLLIIFLTLIMIFSLSACSADKTTGDLRSENDQINETVQIASLKGPTSMGLVKLMSDEENKEDSPYDFNIVTMPDEVVASISAGEIDIATVPANLASVLYNKTGGKIKVATINTLGVLYIVENGETISDFDDLEGKTIYSTGKGLSPEHVLNYVLSKNGLVPNEDVNIEFKSEATEVATMLAGEEHIVAMLQEPFISTAKMKNDSIRTVFDMTEEWENLQPENGSSLVTGVLVVRDEFLNENKDIFDQFLAQYQESIDYANNNIDETAKLIEEYGIIEEDVAKTALPKCNITYIEGSQLRQSLEGYLEILHSSNPESIGGNLPDEEFYYVK